MGKKEKTVYIDDGRTIADMSGITAGPRLAKSPSRSTGKEKWQTFWGAFKMMLLPAAVFAGALLLLYGVISIVFTLM